jgi:hypothetical protein
MKIGLSEKQYKTILTYVSENHEVTEDEEVPSAEPEAGTSSQQSGGQGYPEVGKWESGVTRGPANQVGVTKWSDIVGSTLKRGKSNQLKEQSEPNQEVEGEYSLWSGTPTETHRTVWGEEIKIPTDGTIKITLWKEGDDKLKIFSSNKNYDQDGKWYLSDGKTPTPKPSKEYMDLIIQTGTIRFIKVVNENITYTTSIVLKSNVWDIANYYKSGDKVYDAEEYVTRGFKQWWSDNWEIVLTIVASAVAGLLTGGMSIWAQAAAQAFAGVAAATFAHFVTDADKRDNVGYGINILLSFVPFTSAGLKIGIKAPLKSLPKIAPKLNGAKSMGEVFDLIKQLDPPDQLLATRMIRQVPKEFNREFKTKLMEGFVKSVRKGEIIITKIPFKERMWWKQMAVELGIQLSLGSTLNLPEIRTWLDKMIERATSTKEELEKKKIEDENTKKQIELEKQIIEKTNYLSQKNNNISDEVFDEIFSPVLWEYEDLRMSNSGEDNLKYLNIYETVLIEYEKNPNVDLSLIVKTKYGKNEQ